MNTIFDKVKYLFNPKNDFSKEYIAERLASLLIIYADRYKDIKDKMDYEEWLNKHKELIEKIMKFFNTEKLSEFQEWKMQPIDINRIEHTIKEKNYDNSKNIRKMD